MEPFSLSLAYAMIAAGFLLMVAELFIPSGGILGVLSGCGIVGGVILTFYHDTSTGFWTMLAVGFALPFVAGISLHYWPKTPLGRRFVLTAPGEDATVASLPEHVELEDLRGQTGQAVSALRPAGVVEFNNRRIDCITEGIMVEKGQWVRCLTVRAGKVVVRPVEKPSLTDLESAEFS